MTRLTFGQRSDHLDRDEEERDLPRPVRERLDRVYSEFARIERKLALRIPIEYRCEGTSVWLRREGLRYLTGLYYGLERQITVTLSNQPYDEASACSSTITVNSLEQAELLLSAVQLSRLEAEQLPLFTSRDLDLLCTADAAGTLPQQGPVPLTRFLWRAESLEISPRAIW
jgi:hypothetical protein